MKCPHCNETHPDNSKFCTTTGKPITGEPHIDKSSMQLCPRCSRPIPSDLSFCIWCGANLSEQLSDNRNLLDEPGKNVKNGEKRNEYDEFGTEKIKPKGQKSFKAVTILLVIFALFASVLLMFLSGLLPLNSSLADLRNHILGWVNIDLTQETSGVAVAEEIPERTEVFIENATQTSEPTLAPSTLPTPIQDSTPTEVMETTQEIHNYAPGDQLRSDHDGMKLIYVPEGNFTMGSNWSPDEEPEHVVYLDAFFIDETEVTNAMYERCVDEGTCSPPLDFSSKSHSNYYGNSQYNNFPVVNVDWKQANTYCEWAGRRLPTEAEWEKAARGEDGNVFPWGDYFSCKNGNFDDETQFDDYTVDGGEGCDGFIEIAPVGSFLSGASPYKVLDMSGNVWEWVADKYESIYYREQPSENPLGPEKGSNRVMRGGSWDNNATYIRAAKRLSNNANSYFNNAGFRCAFTP